MANNFFQNEKFLQYETSLIAKSDIQGTRGKLTRVAPEILKSGSPDKDKFTTDGAQRGTLLEIIPMHIKNPPRITFMAFLDAFTDTLNPEYSAQQVYGRNDAYHIWKGSRRSIRLSWVIPSSGKNMALRNLSHISWFMASLYPAYKEVGGGSNAVSASPLFRVKYANMITSANYPLEGLLCVIKNVQLSHNKKAGFISMKPGGQGQLTRDVGEGEGGDIGIVGDIGGINDGSIFDDLMGTVETRPEYFLIPMEYKISCNLDIIHEHSLGWDHETGAWRGTSPGGKIAEAVSDVDVGRLFPYGLELNKGLSTDKPGAEPPEDSGYDVVDDLPEVPDDLNCIDVNPADGYCDKPDGAEHTERIADLDGSGFAPDAVGEKNTFAAVSD